MQASATPAPASRSGAASASDVSPGTIAAIQASETMDDELKQAMAMSVEPASAPNASAPADVGMAGLYDAGFLSTVLSSLPGVDTSDPRVQGVLEGIKKDEKKSEKPEDKDEKK